MFGSRFIGRDDVLRTRIGTMNIQLKQTANGSPSPWGEGGGEGDRDVRQPKWFMEGGVLAQGSLEAARTELWLRDSILTPESVPFAPL
jgi:hypothetical protein